MENKKVPDVTRWRNSMTCLAIGSVNYVKILIRFSKVKGIGNFDPLSNTDAIIFIFSCFKATICEFESTWK